jgi:hypothetical protein
MKILTQRDHPLDYVVFAQPEDMYKQCRVADYIERGKGPVHRDLRRAFKASAMSFHKPTQILRETTAGAVFSQSRELDHPSRIAWNLLTRLQTMKESSAACLPRIPNSDATFIPPRVLVAREDYGIVRDAFLQKGPQRVVVHKSSRFENAEGEGFEEALRAVSRYDLVALRPDSNIRLARAASILLFAAPRSNSETIRTFIRAVICPASGSIHMGMFPRRCRSPIMSAIPLVRSFCGRSSF